MREATHSGGATFDYRRLMVRFEKPDLHETAASDSWQYAAPPDSNIWYLAPPRDDGTWYVPTTDGGGADLRSRNKDNFPRDTADQFR